MRTKVTGLRAKPGCALHLKKRRAGGHRQELLQRPGGGDGGKSNFGIGKGHFGQQPFIWPGAAEIRVHHMGHRVDHDPAVFELERAVVGVVHAIEVQNLRAFGQPQFGLQQGGQSITTRLTSA